MVHGFTTFEEVSAGSGASGLFHVCNSRCKIADLCITQQYKISTSYVNLDAIMLGRD
jgi:hypothetical protein